mmetsp:Transcript_37042/g.98669  ORF Transcript_37042/g.98669 Transcript_37042/m.98669 type:complete len:237 (-) Transcript_37042:193-903(-)
MSRSREMSARSWMIQYITRLGRSEELFRMSISMHSGISFTMYLSELQLFASGTSVVVLLCRPAPLDKFSEKTGSLPASVISSPVKFDRLTMKSWHRKSWARRSTRDTSPWVKRLAAMALMSVKLRRIWSRVSVSRIAFLSPSSVPLAKARAMVTVAKAWICENASPHLLYMKCRCVTASQYRAQDRLVLNTHAKPNKTPTACSAYLSGIFGAKGESMKMRCWRTPVATAMNKLLTI